LLHAFVDDSSSAVGEKRHLLAGFILPDVTWKAFEVMWAAELRKPRRLNVLHMASCFHGFTNEERIEKLAGLCGVIGAFRPMSVVCSVSQVDFVEVYRDNVPYDFRHPYFLCFFGIINATLLIASQSAHPVPIEFTFDDQGNVGRNSLIWHALAHQFLPEEMRALAPNLPSFDSDSESLPLQAADMLAWHMRRGHDFELSKFEREVRNTLTRALVVDIHWSRESLRELVDGFSQWEDIEYRKTRKGSIVRRVLKQMGHQ
jgi:hypothetical protein